MIFPEYGITTGVTLEEPAQLFVRGSILRAKITDMKSPISYGYDNADLPVYFNQAPVLSVPTGGFAGFGGGRGGAPGTNPNAGIGQNVTPNATPLRIQPLEADTNEPAAGASRERPAADDMAQMRQMAQQFGITIDDTKARVVIQFAANPSDMLLSGTLANGQFLANRAAALDHPLGKGHVVMFAIRPFWRWQTQGTYTLGFNAILNWNDLDAGKAVPGAAGTGSIP